MHFISHHSIIVCWKNPAGFERTQNSEYSLSLISLSHSMPFFLSPFPSLYFVSHSRWEGDIKVNSGQMSTSLFTLPIDFVPSCLDPVVLPDREAKHRLNFSDPGTADRQNSFISLLFHISQSTDGGIDSSWDEKLWFSLLSLFILWWSGLCVTSIWWVTIFCGRIFSGYKNAVDLDESWTIKCSSRNPSTQHSSPPLLSLSLSFQKTSCNKRSVCCDSIFGYLNEVISEWSTFQREREREREWNGEKVS